MPIALFLLAGAALFGAYLVLDQEQGSDEPAAPDLGSGQLPASTVDPAPIVDALDASSLVAGAALGGTNILGFPMSNKTYTPPKAAASYLDTINSASAANGLPDGLLARQLDEESAYLPDIISGKRKSAAGAIGIAQIVPKWNPGVDPYDPIASINYAAKKMRGLFNLFGSWKQALAAYNWGEGNLQKFGMARLPTETRNYVDQISGDTGVS